MLSNNGICAADSCDSSEPESWLSIERDALAKIREVRDEDVIGHDFVILHLKSEVGKNLNHHKCQVLDFDHENPWEGRYQCQILTGEKKNKMYKLKLVNLGEYASKALTILPQPTSDDLMEPREFVIYMIMAYSSYRFEKPSPKIEPFQSKFISPDAEGRSLLIARSVIYHLGLQNSIINGLENEGCFSISEMCAKAKLEELVNSLQKLDPEFFDGHRAFDYCTAYYIKMKEHKIRNDPAVLKRFQAKNFSDTNAFKNKRRLHKALEITLQYIMLYLYEPENENIPELAVFHKIRETMEEVDITKPLQCGKVMGNNILPLFKDLDTADKDAHTHFYLKHGLATQRTCYGDETVDFRRFRFGLAGGSNLPNCFLCTYKISINDLRVAKLDCHHIFHQKCILELWAPGGENYKKCPICKEKHFFAESYELIEQLHNRFFKFIIFGRCERCSSFEEERKDYHGFPNLYD